MSPPLILAVIAAAMLGHLAIRTHDIADRLGALTQAASTIDPAKAAA